MPSSESPSHWTTSRRARDPEPVERVVGELVGGADAERGEHAERRQVVGQDPARQPRRRSSAGGASPASRAGSSPRASPPPTSRVLFLPHRPTVPEPAPGGFDARQDTTARRSCALPHCALRSSWPAALPPRAAGALGRPRARRGEATRRDDPPHQVRRPAHHAPTTSARSASATRYAFAEDNICTIADTYVTVSGRALALLRPGRVMALLRQRRVNNNLDSDFFYAAGQRLGHRRGPDLRDRRRRARSATLRKVVRGLRRGLQRLPAQDRASTRLPDQRCRGADWVRPITEDRRLPALPPARQPRQLRRRDRRDRRRGAGPRPGRRRRREASPDASRRGRSSPASAGTSSRSKPAPTPTASAREATANGRGMVLGNPHFPWDGAERLYQAHAHDSRASSTSPAPASTACRAVLIGHTRRARLVAHGGLRLALHPVRADPGPGRPALLPRRRPAAGRWRRAR